MDARAARNLCLYLDDLLKSKLRTVPEGEVEGELDKAVLLFRFVQDKDVFESFYKQLLAKRLLAGRCGLVLPLVCTCLRAAPLRWRSRTHARTLRRSVSDDAERLMVTKLKTECGYQFTSKLEGMFQDLRVSEDIQEKFRDQAGVRRRCLCMCMCMRPHHARLTRERAARRGGCGAGCASADHRALAVQVRAQVHPAAGAGGMLPRL